MTEHNPMDIAGPGAGHNSEGETETKLDIFKAIDSLYEEAGHWADGNDVENQQQHDAVTLIRDTLHELGRKADELRKEEKKPLDDKVDAIQKEFNPYVQPKKGKVDKAKAALDKVLTSFRVREQARKDEIARKEREEAAEELRRAQEAIRASSGNLQARDEAEEMLERAKETQKFARRAERDANTSTGLRTVRRITLPEDGRGAALDWAFERDAEAFYSMAIDMATDYYRATKQAAPGFVITEEKVAH